MGERALFKGPHWPHRGTAAIREITQATAEGCLYVEIGVLARVAYAERTH